MSVLSRYGTGRSPMLIRETAPGGKTHRRRGEPRPRRRSKAENPPLIVGDEVGVVRMFGDPAPHERAVGQDSQVAFPGRLQAGLDEGLGDAVAAEPRVGLGVQERDRPVAQAVLEEAGELDVRPDLELRLFWVVGDLQVHAPKDIDRAKPKASRASGGHASWDSGSRLNHSFIGVPLLASNRSPWPPATRSSTRSRGSLTTSWPRTNIAKIFLR